MKGPFQFRKHYTVDEARALLPTINGWLERLEHHRERILTLEKRLASLLAQGSDLGGDTVNEWIRGLSEMKVLLCFFAEREIQIKDLERGLIDFPALRDGREVFLCWEKGEEDIEHWHELDAGYAGREPLD